MKREDFPATVPPETVERILALQATVRRGSWPSMLVFGISVVVGLGLFIAAGMFDWPLWAHSLGVVVFAAGAKLTQVLGVRSSQAELVKAGDTCPKCQQPLHRSGQSAADAQEEWRTVMSGRCPRCFEPIGPNVLDPDQLPAPETV